MSDFPDHQNPELHDLVEGWKLASCSSWTPETFAELLRWVRERIPVASFTLFELETASSELVQRARVQASSGNATGGNASVESLRRPCSEVERTEQMGRDRGVFETSKPQAVR